MTIISARRVPRVHRPSRSQQPGIVAGLRYERALVNAIKFYLDPDFVIEHNPWFYYTTSENQSGACAPDILIHDTGMDRVIVIEVKYTWVEGALEKLKTLYCPVVELALGVKTRPLVVVKRLTPEAPKPSLGLLEPGATLFQWTTLGKLAL